MSMEQHSPNEKSKISSTNVDASGQMRGWFKLIETIRKTDPPCSSSNELFNNTTRIHTNGYTIPIDSPQSESPNFISSSPPSPIVDTPSIIEEPKTKLTGSKRRSLRHKKITIRKSTRSKEFNSIPDDEPITLDIHQRKRQSNESLSTIPLATDLQSLPGLHQDEIRDQRFAHYSDLNTLSTHFHACLCIDKKPFPTSFFSKQHIFKTRHNILTKIFKLAYLKTHPNDLKELFSNKSDAQQYPPSSTSISFKTDWSVNRRQSSSHRHEPKNVFHILQHKPKKYLFQSNDHHPTTNVSHENQQSIHYEHMKDLLIRTYYPHYHAAFQCGYYFGTKSKFPVQQNELLRSNISSDTETPSIFQRQSKKRERRSKRTRIEEKPAIIHPSKRRVSEEIPPVDIPIPTEILVNNNRKRPSTSNTQERKKKYIVSMPSPEIEFEEQNLSMSDSEDEPLPDELPKQNFIKNGLRSNYYKSSSNTDSKSTRIIPDRFSHRRSQPSGSLPPFYTGLFQSNDKTFSYVNYRLPYDIYWSSQNIPKKPVYRSKKKLSISQKNIVRLPSMNNMSMISTRHIEDLTVDEKRIVSQSSIFLQRNLRRIKEKRQRKDQHQHEPKQQQQIDEQPLPLFFAQNYYHSTKTICTSENSFDLSHQDLLNFFVNHIRRSQFGKLGRCSMELIDSTCSYAQLAQLTIILNEIFDLLLNYKCQNSDIYPSNALKKCPLKRLFPMYYELISKPIDLTMIEQKLDHGEYHCYSSFENDLLLLFHNAITYCGEDSDVGRAVKELERYFLVQLKSQYQSTMNLFPHFDDEHFRERNLKIFKDFIGRLHRKEMLEGQIREILFEMIFHIDTQQTSSSHIHPPLRLIKNNWIVHCRCGSTHDEIPLVQCYACQLWQHVSCVIIKDSFRPYYCFECHPLCEDNPSICLKMNIEISQEDPTYYSVITRIDGLMIRINECYFVRKEMKYEIFFVERLWFDEHHIGRASGFYYLRPMETFHEANRKFFSNELVRFPSTNDSIELNSIIRPCYVLDTGTFCKGKPLAEYTSRISSRDLFICEYRVDKSARTFTRVPKSKQITINTKAYCFDNYIEKLSIKRESQSQTRSVSRRRSINSSNKLTAKQLEEKSSHIDGLIEKIYCHFHHPNLIPTEAKFSPEQFVDPQSSVDQNNNRGRKRLRDKPVTMPIKLIKKRRTRSFSDNDQQILSNLLYELIDSIASHIV